MLLKIGLQNNFENKCLAWVLDYPGCVAYGKEASEAIVNVPQTLVAYQSWIGDHTSDSWLADLGNFDVRLAEVIDANENESAKSNWFQHDALPLTSVEAEQGSQILSWLRADLLDWVSTLNSRHLDQTFTGEKWSIRGVLRHIADAEFWYVGRLGMPGTPSTQLPEDVFDRLRVIREMLVKSLPEWIDKEEIFEMDQEFWSARKVLRRAAWHEKDHIQHLLRLMTLLS